MNDTIARYLNAVPDSQSRKYLQIILNAIADRYSACMLSTAGLVIKAGGSALVKTGATAFVALTNNGIANILVTKAAATDMAALVGTVVNATFNVFVYYIDNAGTLTSAMGTAGATLSAVTFPPTPQGKAIVGFTIINPTGTGNFVGGTTAIDDATVVPNAVHVSPLGAFDPTVILGAVTP